MSTLDAIAVGVYLLVVVWAGLRARRAAKADLDAYFLGGRRIHWLGLAMSGSVSNFDITGTMWMVSMLVLLGMQSWWHHWMWGVALPAFALAFQARWVRRSGVMTAAEWMVTRFGEGRGGRAARYATALMAVVTTAAMVGYAFQGIGKFAIEYFPPELLARVLPLEEAWLELHGQHLLASLILALTAVYVMAGGLVGVVITDVIQTIVLSCAAIWIAVLAFQTVDPSALPEGFARLTPSWRMEHLAGGEHAEYAAFGLLAIVWFAKGLLMNAGGPSQQYDFQRFLAAADDRDAAKIAAAWPLFLIPRWAMVMGIALLFLGGTLEVTDPERVMPLVLQEHLPDGVRGLVLAGLLAAFMSTFSSTLNAGASYVVRDLWQPLFRPHASQAALVRAGAWSTLGLVLAGMAIGYRAGSIGSIWGWLMMALGAGVILPNFLRWFWWRLNGWGYTAGLLGGIALSLLALAAPATPTYVLFPVICAGSLAGCVACSLMTAPVESEVLQSFYTHIRPFGAWGPVRQGIPAAELPPAPHERAGVGLVDAALGVVALTALYLGPMYVVGRWFGRAGVCLAVLLIAGGWLVWRLRGRAAGSAPGAPPVE